MGHGHQHGLSRRAFLQRAGAAAGATGVASLLPQVTGLASALAQEAGGPLRAGAAVVDITPENGQAFFGYVRPDRTANGVAVRLYARTLVLASGDSQVALVTCDLGATLDKAGVMDLVGDIGFDQTNVLLGCTHTHAGPDEWTDWIEAQIADSIRQAHADLAPARAAWAVGTVDGVNQTRSVEAHLANHGIDMPPFTGSPDLDPDGPDHARDTTIRMLRVDRPDGSPLMAWSIFAVHPTNFPNTNTLYSADLSGLAVRHFEATFGDGPDASGVLAPTREGVPIGVLANGNQGDMISLYESHNPHSSADLMGRRLAVEMRRLWDDAGTRLADDLAVGSRWTRMGYLGQVVDDEGHMVGDQALWGAPFAGGAKNGPSPFYLDGASEGNRRPAALADPVHGRKIIAAPAPWRNDPELQLARVGSTILIAVPGEATVETGRRVNAAALAAAPAGVMDAVLVGLSNDYVGYFTTPEEYDQQHYEGSHTVFGKYTSVLLQSVGADLTSALASSGDAPAPATGTSSPYPLPGGPGGEVGAGADTGTIAVEPVCDVARFDVVAVKWDGGAGGSDRPVGAPFVLVERRADDGSWTPIDSDLGVAMHWTEESGRHLATWDVARGAVPGVHRFRVTAVRYEVVSAPFVVRAASTLVVRGAEVRGGDLVFLAQHPTPDPEVHLRYREQSARGGTLTFVADGRERTARWDEGQGGWAAPRDDLALGDTVDVAVGGLVDGAGNTNGEATTVTIGQVDDPVWPADMAIGGTDRDWHGHAPSEVQFERQADCAIPAVGAAAGDGVTDGAPDADPPGAGPAASGAPDVAGGSGAGSSLPATGGGVIAAGAAIVAAAALRRGSRGQRDPRD